LGKHWKWLFEEDYMKRLRPVLGALIFIGLFASGSLAGTAGRTFVSSLGVDTNPCSLAAPCRTFAQAISQTAEGGEVVVLNSAGYGPFTISQSVAITAPEGIYAGITQGSAAGAGINIEAGPNDVVTLKGLTIIGPGASVSSGNGVAFESGAALHVEGCEVRGFNIDIELTSPGQTFIKDTVVKDGMLGVNMFPITDAAMLVSMDNVTANNNLAVGIELELVDSNAPVNASIYDSTISGNGVGVEETIMTAGTAQLDFESCLITNNTIEGIRTNQVTGTAAISISNCLIDHSPLGVVIDGGSVSSRHNNTITGNGTNVVGTLTVLFGQ
jgi:hypothetical protein